MSPIEQVRPALPGNWPRRVENRNRRDGERRPAREGEPPASDRDKARHDEPREHVIDDLA